MSVATPPADWFSGAVSAAVVFIGGLVGYGKLRGDVSSLRRDVDDKASLDLVNTQYQAILREINAIREDLRG